MVQNRIKTKGRIGKSNPDKDSFEAVAKRLGADEDKDRFEAKLGKIAKVAPKRAK